MVSTLKTSRIAISGIGEEWNPRWNQSRHKILVVRLSPARDVDSSTPHLFLAHEIRTALPEAYIDFSFFPTSSERAELSRLGLPWSYGVFSKRPMRDFDLVFISNSYTLELINLPLILRKSGFEVFSSRRAETDPLIVMGGSNILASQACVNETLDAMPDALFFGEGELVAGRLALRCAELSAMPKRDRLSLLAEEFPSLWPSGYTNKRVKSIFRLPVESQGHEGILPSRYPLLNGPEAATARLQIAWGCPSFCSFCFEGYERKPYRELSSQALLKEAMELKKNSGANTLELYGFNFNTHENIVDLVYGLNSIFRRVNFMSQRVDILNRAPGLLEFEIAAGKRSYTLGIEGISARMRSFYAKGLSTEDIHGLIDRLIENRFREIKFFFILSGFEEEQDYMEFGALLDRLKSPRESKAGQTRILFSFGLLVRMPFTPLRYAELILDDKAWRVIIDRTRAAVEGRGLEFRLATELHEYQLNQALALSGYWMAEILDESSKAGFCYDRGLEKGSWDFFKKRLASNLDPSFLREKPCDYPFAFEFLDTCVTPSFLYSRFIEAKSFRELTSCFEGECVACESCECKEEREFLRNHRIDVTSTRKRREDIEELLRAKDSKLPLIVEAIVPPGYCGSGPELLGAWLCRELFMRIPKTLDGLFTAEELIVSKVGPRLPRFWGKSLFALYAKDSELLYEQIESFLSTNPDSFPITKTLELARADSVSIDRFSRVEFSITLTHSSMQEARLAIEDWLRIGRLRFTTRKADIGYLFEISQDDFKKKLARQVTLSSQDIDSLSLRIDIVSGPRVDLGPLIDALPKIDASISPIWMKSLD